MAHETPKDPPKGTRRFYFTLTPLALFVLPVRATSCWLVPVSQILKCNFLRPSPCPARRMAPLVLRFARASAAAPTTTPAQDVRARRIARHLQAKSTSAESWKGWR